jgi:hypothetical protein
LIKTTSQEDINKKEINIMKSIRRMAKPVSLFMAILRRLTMILCFAKGSPEIRFNLDSNNYSRYLLILILSVMLLPSSGRAGQYAWVDYRNILAEKIRVCSAESANIKVDMPFEFLKNQSEYIVIVADLKDLLHEYTYVDMRNHISAVVSVNGKPHRISARDYDHAVEIKIKTKYFTPGENTIKVYIQTIKSDSLSPYIFCGFEINKMYFKTDSLSSLKLAKSSRQSEPGVPIVTSPFLTETTFIKSQNTEKNIDAIAVVIGNQTYSHKDIPSVKYAGNDASVVKKYLLDTLGYKDGNIIFESDTTKAGLEKIFGTEKNHRGMLNNYIKPNKSDVFIYYSGHGAPDPNTNKAYLVPTDCDPVMMDLTAYPLDVLYSNLPKIEAKSVTVVIDACFSGGTNTGKWLVSNASPALIKISNPVTAQNNITILTSADYNQVSSWYPEKQHSMFTYFFLKAVTGNADFNKDKRITFQEIYNFVADRAEGVPYYSKRLHGGRTQTPMMHAANKDAVFVNY